MFCAARESKRRGAVRPPALLRVELDDELFLCRERDVLALRHADDPTNPVLFIKGQPLGNRRSGAGLQSFLDREEVQVLSLTATSSPTRTRKLGTSTTRPFTSTCRCRTSCRA